MSVTLRRLDAQLRAVGEHEYRHATIVPRLNRAGMFMVTLDADQAVGLAPGTRVLFSDDRGAIMAGMVWQRRRIDQPEGPEGDRVVVVQGRSELHRLAGRLAYPDPSLEADDDAQPATWDRTGPAGELLADMVALNAGPLALADRRIPGLEVPTATGVGATVRARRRFPVVADEIERLGAAGGVACDMVRPADEAVLRFTVRAVVDVSTEVFFSVGRGNLYGFELELTHPQATVAVVAGRGEGADRTIRLRQLEVAQWGRWEAWVDARAVGDPDDSDVQHAADLDDEGDAALAELRARTNLAADVVDLPGSPVQWRRDYELGDVVGVVVDGEQYTAQVVEVTVDASGAAGTTYTPAVGGITPRRRLELLDRLKAVEARVAAQERA